MYLAINVSHYKDVEKTEREKLEMFSKLGFKYVSGIGKPAEQMTEKDAVELKKILDDNGMEIVEGGGGIKTWGTFDTRETDDVLDTAKRYLDCASIFNTKATCILTPRWTWDIGKEEMWATSIPFYRKYGKLLKERGMFASVLFEPMMYYITEYWPEAIRWMDDIDCDNFYIALDTAHILFHRLKAEKLKYYTNRVINVQLSDATQEYHECWALGTGDVRIMDIMNTLTDNGVDETAQKAGVVGAAILKLYYPRHTGPNYYDELMTSLDYCRENLPQLKLK